jgi:phenylacetate-CoA ligase
MRGHRWVGINPGDKELYFWASPVELNTQGRLKQIRDMLVNNPLTSALALSPAVIPEFLKLWLRWRPKCIFTYASSAALFARMARSMHVDLTLLREAGLQSVITTAEMLCDIDRARISETFGVPVYDSYGLREGGLIGHECDRFTMHTNDEQILLETIDPETLKPTDGEGELVLTNLASHVQPVIRYRTNDIVTLSQGRCPCGRTLSQVRVTGGRLHDFVVTRDGRWISCVNFLYICKSVPGILELQARQERLGEVHLLVVPEADRPAGLADRIMAEARARLGPGEEIAVQFVDHIKPTKSGKYRVVVSTVATQMLADNKYTP